MDMQKVYIDKCGHCKTNLDIVDYTCQLCFRDIKTLSPKCQRCDSWQPGAFPVLCSNCQKTPDALETLKRKNLWVQCKWCKNPLAIVRGLKSEKMAFSAMPLFGMSKVFYCNQKCFDSKHWRLGRGRKQEKNT